MPRDDEFAAFVAARYRALVRTGLLLAGDTGHADRLATLAAYAPESRRWYALPSPPARPDLVANPISAGDRL